TRVATAGYAGFTGYVEGGRYSYDNYTQTSFAGANPQPQVTGLAPESVLAGSGALTLTVTGQGFVPGSQVLWNGAVRSTTYVSPTELRASIGALDVAAAGTASVTVVSPAPGGGESNAVTFTIEALTGNPVPVLEAWSPTTAVAGGAQFTLTVTGQGFVPESQVLWNGAARATTYVSATELRATIAAEDVAAAGSVAVAVQSPAPGGGTSNVMSFLVTGLGGSFFDDFERADGADLGNGWIEKTPAAFSLQGGRVVKSPTSVGFADNVVYRPEPMLDGEASIEVRFSSLPPGYAQVFVRGQPDTIGSPGLFTGYLLFIDDSASRAYLDRIENGGFVVLQQITLSPALNTTDTFRLRLRATGTDPVVVTAYVERLTGEEWTVSGKATVTDTSATRVATAGYAGFTGYVEGGRYSYDNYTRTSFDG